MGVLTDFETEFLTENNALAGVDGIDYNDPLIATPEQGQTGAWLRLKERALGKASLTLDDVRTANRWICDEQTRAGIFPRTETGALRGEDFSMGAFNAPPATLIPTLLEEFVEELETQLLAPGPPRDFYGGHTLHLAGHFFHRFLVLHPFEDANGRLGRMLANFVLLRKNWPLIVFRAQDRERLIGAQASGAHMGALLVEKVRESVSCGSCRVGRVERIKQGLEVDTYHCTGCGVEFKLDWKGLLGSFKKSTEMPVWGHSTVPEID